MIRLLIDGIEATLLRNTRVMQPYNISMLRDIDGWRSGMDVEVEIASSPEIDELMRHAADLHRAEEFNAESHTACIELHGIPIFEGMATLLSTTSERGTRSYSLRLRQGGSLWAKNAAITRLSDSLVEESRDVTLGEIEHSWSDGGAICFLPLQQDSYPKPTPTGIFGIERMRSPSDYHPFLSIPKIIESIVKSGNCTLHSDFMQGELFQKLMMSGALSSTDIEVAEQDMGFKALRTYSSTATAGEAGKVNVCEPQFGINLGAIVNSVDPMAQDESGNRLSDAYTNNNSLDRKSVV